MNKPLFAIVLVSLIAVSGCSAVNTISPVGVNCALTSPPDASGVDGDHGTVMRIFPRKSDIGDSYSGCQTVWVSDNGQWLPFMVGIFEGGKLTRMRIPWRPGDPLEQCLKSSGVLVRGDKNICSEIDYLFPYSSAPPSCLATSASGAYCIYD